MDLKQPQIKTERSILRLANSEDAPAILNYYTENKSHFTPWWPKWKANFFTNEYWEERIVQDLADFSEDRAIRLLIIPKLPTKRVIGIINFNQIYRGVFHACYVGYGLDHREEGKGLMTEALSAAIAYIFQERNFHRVMAAYMPQNEKSGAVLKRLGFSVEGYARDYLQIDGKWQDHILTALINTKWKADSEQNITLYPIISPL